MKLTSTSYATETGIRDLQARRDAMQHTQSQISSGRRVVSPGDDPVAAASGERARAQLSRIDVERRALTFARGTLGIADGAIGDATGLLQNARETLVAAGNGTYNASDRATLAEQLVQARDQLLAVANTPDGSGGYVFGGLGTQTAPFRDGGSPTVPVTYTAVPGQQKVGGPLQLATSLDGQSAFTAQAAAGGGTQSIFTVLDGAIAALRDPGGTTATVGAMVSGALAGVDVGIDAMQLKRTQVGEQLRAIDAREQTLSGTELQTRSTLSDLTDVDLAQALSQLSNQQTAMDAAMKTYAQISQMSLFKYI